LYHEVNINVVTVSKDSGTLTNQKDKRNLGEGLFMNIMSSIYVCYYCCFNIINYLMH